MTHIHSRLIKMYQKQKGPVSIYLIAKYHGPTYCLVCLSTLDSLDNIQRERERERERVSESEREKTKY